MRSIILLVLASVFGFGASATAQAPVAVVEDVKGKVSGVEFMDYVAPGKLIKLGPKDSIVLSYMKSCLRETITGGVVIVGDEQSRVQLGTVERTKVDCDAGAMQLTDREASQSAATVFRSLTPAQRAATPPQITLYGRSPIVEINGPGTLVVERLDKQGERHEVTIGSKSLVRGKFYDFAKARKALTPGGTYVASFGTQKIVFKIDPGAKPGSMPVISRLLRFVEAH